MNTEPRASFASRLRAFAARETVLVVAAAAALASCALVPPDAGYAEYVDWRTLALLFCLMAVVAGFRKLGVLDAAGAWLVARARTPRAIAAALVGLAFFASMLVTNDVALITFVPLALVVLRGSIAIDGISLTVAELFDDAFEVSIIPHTAAQTTLSSRKPGDCVNLENDVVGKYVQRLLYNSHAAPGSSTSQAKPESTATAGSAEPSPLSLAYLTTHGF